ncbi:MULTISPECIES: M15 family metallopeptidase [Moorena]|uniref:Metallo peptidase, MEROPS family M15B n=1 Tax=Moorena producens 3L TaxID=489825 RepID=F4XL78_9CYAN|nr:MULTISPECIES: M15 family metallopeptidase [Moorena]EGJ34602.1 metallo peptidase, MEROPS family M15B [Moorena producens 3L]NEP69087.1 D-alanyl-D-alanine carboxypeptidase family protein [Moorena sp. SIO3A5]NER90974.1 D-alanyl-D-alanine carboxypeptidase family protein [Moorena sp. SIO3A2]NES42082.1 D-alanyl-D-alanine carboxypeptidase family protein [Moorena sp. SIO2C4]OLT67073.1 D-alanyl-D-alanine carboxypeptidase [Moorena producens 3L]
MNNAGLPGEPANLSEVTEVTVDDIPEAVRDRQDIKPRSRWQVTLLIIGLLAIGGIAFSLIPMEPTPEAQSNLTPSGKATSTQSQTEASSQGNNADNILGHLPYSEVLSSQLQPITRDGRIKLEAAAARKYKAMAAAARRQGVILVPISGFRSVDQQKYLFFQVKEQRGQVASKRAEVSAPPGYSEHHTGYAIDIGDAMAPATNLNPEFENTAAFKWLEKNAAFYSFELSFPRDNPQGISYEPWHWRFVGDTKSLETFYKGKKPTPLPLPSETPKFEDEV